MKKKNLKYLDFEVDKLTRSIENVITGDSFATEISNLSKYELSQISKKNDWLFDWKSEMKFNDREVYKLTIQNNPNIIQGLISVQIEKDHVYMHLLESAPFNRGKHKIYLGVPGNLVAFACKLSFQRGNDGFVSFRAKSKLIEHYIESLGATHFGGQLMILDTIASTKLIDKYFKS